jgi:hypothetical protein
MFQNVGKVCRAETVGHQKAVCRSSASIKKDSSGSSINSEIPTKRTGFSRFWGVGVVGLQTS